MCGLVGVANYRMQDLYKKMFSHLLYIDAIRGWDSTGATSVGVDDSIMTYKKPVAAAHYLRTKPYGKLLGSPSRCLIGHNRAATHGLVNTQNAHPFTHGHITLTHNGTLTTWDALPRGDGVEAFDVDSEAIAHALSVTDDCVSVLEQLQGAYALVWHNSKDDTINFARNSKRPLYYAVNKMGSTLLWASEADMLNLVINKHTYNPEMYTVYELNKGYVLSGKLHVRENFTDMEEKQFTPYTAPVTMWNGHYNSNKGYNNYNNYRGQYVDAKQKLKNFKDKWGIGNDVDEDIRYMEVESVTESTYQNDYVVVRGIDLHTNAPLVCHSFKKYDVLEDDIITGELTYVSEIDGTKHYRGAIINGKVCTEEQEKIILSSLPKVEVVEQKQLTVVEQKCEWCDQPILPHQLKTAIWISEDTPLHDDCYTQFSYNGDFV